jgi:NUMOD1 domain
VKPPNPIVVAFFFLKKATTTHILLFIDGGGEGYYNLEKLTILCNGQVPANAMTINVYDIDNVLVRSFPSQVAAAEWLGINKSTVSRHIKSGIPYGNRNIPLGVREST